MIFRAANDLAMQIYIYDISKKLGIGVSDVLSTAKQLGIVTANAPSSSLDKITAGRLEKECLQIFGSHQKRRVKQKEAAKSFSKAAEAGDAEAQFKLSVCYDKGEGVSQNDCEAMKWLCKAAEQGHADAFKRLVNKADRDERWRKAVPKLAKLLGIKSNIGA